MKKIILSLIIGLIVGAALMGLFVWKKMPSLMLQVVKSRYDFETTVSMLEEASYQNEWEVLHIYDMGDCLFSEGFDDQLLKITILSICQPDYSYHILQDDENRKIAAIMPCRIGVYEDSRGDVYLTRMNIKLFSKMFSGTIGEIMTLVAEDDAKISADIMEE
ncbi:MAG: DUF302 domain-containing protein [Candidatus Cloacimonetes bacterium]|nr:DUF302 domain-containing protein [Candidatus Cloacimonadota bacterium]